MTKAIVNALDGIDDMFGAVMPIRPAPGCESAPIEAPQWATDESTTETA
jgi:hypothetical protein